MSICAMPRPVVLESCLVPVLRELTVLELEQRGVQPRRSSPVLLIFDT